MRKSVVVYSLLSLCVVMMTSCRSRRTVPPPRTAPPAATASAGEPAVPVPTPERDFVAAQPEAGVISEDLTEANRRARERGWIRDAFFAFDASTLDAEAQDALRPSAAWLRDNPEFRIRIEGHCDDRGTEQYNLALGDRRADAAAAYLAALGVDRSRITIVSYGEERPFEEGDGEAAWAQNRRAHLVLSGRR